MSKNIFTVLANNDDSDDEVQRPQQSKKPTKKQQRAKDGQLREKYGDYAPKNSDQAQKRTRNQYLDEKKDKNDYGTGNNRAYERHSGTGKNAFKKGYNKKQGYGKGNTGKYDNEKDYQHEEGKTIEEKIDANVDNVEGQENQLKEEPMEIVTLDEYMGNTGAKFGIKRKDSTKNKDPRLFEDDSTKALIGKKNMRDKNYPKKKYNNQEQKTYGKNIVQVDVSGKPTQDRRYGKKKRIKYDKEEFPELG